MSMQPLSRFNQANLLITAQTLSCSQKQLKKRENDLIESLKGRKRAERPPRHDITLLRARVSSKICTGLAKAKVQGRAKGGLIAVS